MKLEDGNLWRNRDFLKLWGGETVSLFGSHITNLALPLAAALTLNASPAQMGVLNALRYLPFLLITLFAGVWVDRHRRRPILVAADIGRALLMGLIPLLALAGVLAMEHLYAIVFAAGALTVFFDLAYGAYLPSLVERANLVGANSRLQASASAAEVGGPGLAGILTQLVSAPFAILLDALSFVVSALSLWLIRKPEDRPARPDERRDLAREIREGLRVTFGNRYLRAIAGEAATYNLFNTAMDTVFVLYATRRLGIGPGMLGLIVATGSAGALVGAALAGPLGRRLGSGPTILLGMIVGCAAPLLIPLVVDASPVGLGMLVAAYFVGGMAVAVTNVHVVSLRQTITPDHLLGRMTASYRTVIYGTLPIGAMIGGYVGSAFGLRAALFVGALGVLSAVLWVIFSPVPGLRDLSSAAAPASGD